MTTGEKGIQLIKLSEGFVGHVYNDNGKQAIGYGHDILPGEDYLNTTLTEAEGDTLLRLDLKNRFEPAVNALIPADCTQNQFDALMDFCFNLGPANLKTMLSHGWDQVTVQIPRWCHMNGAENAGLLARRQREVELFQTP